MTFSKPSLLTAAMGIALGSNFAVAGSACMGETHSGKVVTVHISTVGTMGSVTGGWVEILNAAGDVETSYNLAADEIPQYNAACRDASCATATVGLQAYADLNWAVSINFVGQNYSNVSEELASEPDGLRGFLRHPRRTKDNGNLMRVWSGVRTERYEDAFYTFKDVVCGLDQDV